MITIIGGGGKTTGLFYLAAKYKKQHKVLISTTTKMMDPQEQVDNMFLLEPEPKETESPASINNVSRDPSLDCGTSDEYSQVNVLFESIEKEGLFGLFNNKIEDQVGVKVTGLDVSLLEKIYGDDIFDYIFVEGDGSKGKSVKAYEDYEPVIPALSDEVWIVVGLDAIGQQITHEVVHRRNLFKQTLGASCFLEDPFQKIQMADILKVMESQAGPLKKIPINAKICLIFNKIQSFPMIFDYNLIKAFCLKNRITSVFEAEFQKGYMKELDI